MSKQSKLPKREQISHGEPVTYEPRKLISDGNKSTEGLNKQKRKNKFNKKKKQTNKAVELKKQMSQEKPFSQGTKKKGKISRGK